MPKYRKKPIVVECMQWRGNNYRELCRFFGKTFFRKSFKTDSKTLCIITREGRMDASCDDWIIQGIAGEFYPCKPEIFAETYEEV